MCVKSFETYSDCATGYLATVLSTAKRLNLFVFCRQL